MSRSMGGRAAWGGRPASPSSRAQRRRGAVLDEGGGLVLGLRGGRPLRLGRRRLARCGEVRPLGGAGAGPQGGAGPHGRLSARPLPLVSVCRTTGPAVPG